MITRYRLLSAAVAIASMGLSACQTGYQPSHGGLVAGYDDMQVSENTFRISVEGNAYTSGERAKRIALLRASEIAIQNGYERFVILGGESGSRTEAGPMVFGRVGRTMVATGGDMNFPENTIMIRLVRRGSPGYDGAMDANLIAQQLRPQLS